jgi:hypothetical protein
MMMLMMRMIIRRIAILLLVLLLMLVRSRTSCSNGEGSTKAQRRRTYLLEFGTVTHLGVSGWGGGGEFFRQP